MRVVTVGIDIKPGSFPNSIQLSSQGVVPVAILSTTNFDATTVDPASVQLAGAQVAIKGKGTYMASTKDVNGDGLLDLVVQVETEALQLSEGDTTAVLTAKTPERATKGEPVTPVSAPVVAFAEKARTIAEGPGQVQETA